MVNDLLVPPSCRDELGAANQFIADAAKRFSIELSDVVCIAYSASIQEASDYVDQLRMQSMDLRDVDSQQLISSCVASFNKSLILQAFIECVANAITSWESDRGMIPGIISYEHLAHGDSHRTYVWAQSPFRKIVRELAHNRLTKHSSVGTLMEPGSSSMLPTRGPVSRLLEWIDFEYFHFLGFCPLPES